MRTAVAVMLLAVVFSLVSFNALAVDITVGTGGEDHTKIQAALDAASNNDVIIVSDGTYTENLSVPGGLTGVTLRSATGMAATTIQFTAAAGPGIDLPTGNDNFTLGGAANQGFTLLSGAGTTFMIQLANGPSDVTISYNTINPSGNASMGLSVGAAGATGLIVSNNSFTTSDDGDGAMYGPALVDVTIDNNVFTATPAQASGYAIQFAGVTGTSAITNNTSTGFAQGISIMNGTGTSDLSISDNTVTGAQKGIRLGQYVPAGVAGDMTTVTISDNTVTANVVGLSLSPDGVNVLASQFVLSGNDFSTNTTFGIQNELTNGEVLDATEHWWGSADGPGGSGSGNGSDVSVGVDYDPWYIDASCLNLSTTASNIVSSPVTVADPAPVVDNTVGVSVDISGAVGTGNLVSCHLSNVG